MSNATDAKLRLLRKRLEAASVGALATVLVHLVSRVARLERATIEISTDGPPAEMDLDKAIEIVDEALERSGG